MKKRLFLVENCKISQLQMDSEDNHLFQWLCNKLEFVGEMIENEFQKKFVEMLANM